MLTMATITRIRSVHTIVVMVTEKDMVIYSLPVNLEQSRPVDGTDIRYTLSAR